MPKGTKRQPKKRQWRKADIDDVEEALEDERLVQKLKRDKGPVGKKSKKAGKDQEGQAEENDDALFTVDTSGSGEGLNAKTRRQIAREKLFPPKAPKLGLSASEQLKVEKAANRLAAPPQKAKGKELFDLWDAPAQTPNAYVLGAEKTKAELEFSAIRRRKAAPAHVPKTLHQKVGVAPAVVLAHEGQSMNPETGAFEELACTAAARQIEAEREAEELDRKLKPMTHELRDALGGDALKDLDDKSKIEKLRDVLVKTAAEDGEDQEEEVTKTRGRRKSQAYRNKQRQRKVEENMLSQEQKQKKLEKSVGEVGALLKEMKQESELTKQRQEYREALKEEKRKLEETQGVVPKRRKLGRNAFREEALVVPDAEAAVKGMRATPLKGSAIKDRLSSIMRRGLLPAQAEASKADIVRMGAKNGRVKRSKKFISPLLRDNLLLR